MARTTSRLRRRTLRQAVGVAIVRAVALEATAGVVLVVGLGVGVPTWGDPVQDATTVATPGSLRSSPDPRLERLMERWSCSTSGLGDRAVPGRALVRGRDGRVRVTGFDRGWASYVGERPGALVAVCP